MFKSQIKKIVIPVEFIENHLQYNVKRSTIYVPYNLTSIEKLSVEYFKALSSHFQPARRELKFDELKAKLRSQCCNWAIIIILNVSRVFRKILLQILRLSENFYLQKLN